MWKYQKISAHRIDIEKKKKVYKNTISKQKSECIRIHRWEKKMVLCICESNVCFRFFQHFFLVFLFHKLSGTYPSSLGIAWVFRFWKVLIFFQFNQIFSNTLQEKAAAENKHISFSKPIFFLFSFLNTDEFVFKIHFSRFILQANQYYYCLTRVFFCQRKNR